MTTKQLNFKPEDFEQAQEAEAILLTDPDQSCDVRCGHCGAMHDFVYAGQDLTGYNFICQECGTTYIVRSRKTWSHSLRQVNSSS